MPLGRFLSVQIDIDGVRTLADFEVIEIIDDSNPYPALLGIEWAMENAAVINLKKRQMTFEGKDLRVIIPLDPSHSILPKEKGTQNPSEMKIRMCWTISTILQRRKKIMLIPMPKVLWIGSVTAPV